MKKEGVDQSDYCRVILVTLLDVLGKEDKRNESYKPLNGSNQKAKGERQWLPGSLEEKTGDQ